TPEGAVMRAVKDLLNAERIPFHRLNSGTILVERDGRKRPRSTQATPKRATRTRAVRLAPPGTADLLALMPGREHRKPVYIEVKGPKGTQSDAQIEFEHEA